MLQNIVPRSWGCIPPTERAANIAMAWSGMGIQAFTLASVIDGIFAAQITTDPDIRRALWETIYQMERIEIEVDEAMVEVYLSNQQWCIDVYTCRLDGGCQIDSPICLQLAFYNLPVSS